MNALTRRGLSNATTCEIRDDDLTRQLYATDASIYQIMPDAVAFPRGTGESASLLRAAADAGLAITPRGAGSGLSGGAVGNGLIVDFARYNRGISDLNIDARTVCVGAGVVLDQLNRFLAPHGLCFGPDVSTSSRATLGGMIACNSSGARAPVYGTTADHLRSVEVVLVDGRVAEIGPNGTGLPEIDRVVRKLVDGSRGAIEKHLPDGGFKRAPGYGYDRYLASGGNLKHIIASSEGTLVGITSAVLELSELPKNKGVAVILFASVEDALQATVELGDLKPAAIEQVDRVLFDQTRGHPLFGAARGLLGLEDENVEAFLIVEFYDDVDERLEKVRSRKLGIRTLVPDPSETPLVWELRKAGLSLLTAMKGPMKPVTGIEDVAVRPERLPDYIRELREIIGKDTRASFYGHAASGLLHVRPILDLHDAQAVLKLRDLGDGVSKLARRYNASFSAEHGLGIARSGHVREQIGPEIFDLTRAVKARFDPRGVMNPGKVVDDGSFQVHTNLRKGVDLQIELPFEPMLAFASRDESLTGNLDQCNGCGGCLKSVPTMCPTYAATGDEVMSTRGRANTVRAVLENRLGGGIDSEDLDVALDNCLSCKACKRECPSNVDLALIKSELLHARHRKNGIPLSARMVAAVDLAGRFGCATARVSNWFIKWHPLRRMLERFAGFDARRSLPPYADERFDHWFDNRNPTTRKPGHRGSVLLWDDTFVRYHEPDIGRAAVDVLEAAGYDVHLPHGRKCCGRPAFSVGCLGRARAWGTTNVNLLSIYGDTPIVFLEPSCYSMFVQDYEELKIEGARRLAERCFLFEDFIDRLLEKDSDALTFSSMTGVGVRKVAIHAHCHAKALADPEVQKRVVERLPATTAELLHTGCCGMAGSFGMMSKTAELSKTVAEPLLELVNDLSADQLFVASGTSCRHQVEELASRKPLHLAELLARALDV
jgi:FAD/FMN-containing dehydrogenase/Fe-S oxidoreductase